MKSFHTVEFSLMSVNGKKEIVGCRIAEMSSTVVESEGREIRSERTILDFIVDARDADKIARSLNLDHWSVNKPAYVPC